ncbi:hypothetical protein TRIATDRAFT_300188 [Trichoderma atroviride IMI 206040]|uniref:Uncharacterized protein n=1 Tax=Hypocrea atroviridis (strain ATCC 20476 / IMI 206040) TaxID=452589 RepID=G9NYX0_HYPAI|nr:uncharacterized protein TRIATDRAFT_300188 [Trichoderma atroviride IMI 206040]EHK43740.1 hypothetical protein TRIATDRAFT_300188 [Trichoderma atroviride IMI 206040]
MPPCTCLYCSFPPPENNGLPSSPASLHVWCSGGHGAAQTAVPWARSGSATTTGCCLLCCFGSMLLLDGTCVCGLASSASHPSEERIE